MIPVLWIGLAYGVVVVTLVVYTLQLRHRLRRAQQAKGLWKDSLPR